MQLKAISDIHLGFEINYKALSSIKKHENSWLILAGDISEDLDHHRYALDILLERFEGISWTPGNHDLWTLPHKPPQLKGQEKYQALVELYRSYGARTPEDEYYTINKAGQSHTIAPLFLLYDYSFRPAEIAFEDAISWAQASEIMCADEHYLHCEPYASKAEWCNARVAYSERRLEQVPNSHKLILVSHFPLRYDLVRLHFIPRFSIWCGTSATEQWHTRFNTAAVVSGHLHIPRTDYKDGVKFEEVSLGYPRQWNQAKGIEHHLKTIL